ncbi:hypothetical protein C8Q74DRAFT_1221649 [Fomes fomentarius]|nr:hypothetical protein C8Q74DRAFT_1221649 [Fomes fomentarius]
MQKHYSNNMWTFMTVKDFWDKLDKYFIDLNLAKITQAQLKKCYMGNHKDNNLFQDFEKLVQQAGFKMTNAHALKIFSSAMPTLPSSKQSMHPTTNLPTMTHGSCASRILTNSSTKARSLCIVHT